MTGPVTVAVVAFAGFNEIDVLANLHILNRVTRTRPHVDLVARLVGPAPTLRSMYTATSPPPAGASPPPT